MIEILYSSMYSKEQINSIEEFVKKVSAKHVQLYLDTNICIFLREFYNEPLKTVSRNDNLWDELKKLLYFIEKYDLIVDYSVGAEEACRNKCDFDINYDKLAEMHYSLQSLFEMNYSEIIEYSRLIKFNKPTKDSSTLRDTKINNLDKKSIFQEVLFLTYACLLKIFILATTPGSKSKQQLMIDYLDFLDKELDIIGTSCLLYGHYYLSGNTFFKKMIHKSKNTAEDKLNALWNAAIDLTLPTLISHKYGNQNTVPVFVTADKYLWSFFNLQKVRAIVTGEGNKIIGPPFIEMDLQGTEWNEEELVIIDDHFYKIANRRRNTTIKRAINKEDPNERISRLHHICYGLEKLAKSIIST